MKKTLLFLLPALGVLIFSFNSKSEKISAYHSDTIDGVEFNSNPPAARTGAPGEGNCTACHSGAVMSGEGVIFFTIGGGPNYIPGQVYPVTISTIGGPRNGFQLTILDGANNAAGTFTAGANSNVTTSGGRRYVRHSASEGQISWTFDWTAPATEMGELTAYYSMIKSNNNGSDSGDELFLGNTAIPLIGASIAENELEMGYRVFYNPVDQILNLNYVLTDESKVVLNVQDLSGRLIQYYDLGNQTEGAYKEVITLDKVNPSGVYLISLLINNRVLNRKVVI